MLKLKKTITPEVYENMPEDDQDWYAPDYKKYDVKKQRTYAECDLGFKHFMGWEERRTPIGKPYRYIKVGDYEHMMNVSYKMMQPVIQEQICNSNVLTERILNSNRKWKQ